MSASSRFKTTGVSVENWGDGFTLKNDPVYDAELVFGDRFDQRDQLCKRLRLEGGEAEAEALEKCGEEVNLACRCCGNRVHAKTHCDKRHCPLCAPFLADERVRKTERQVSMMQWPLAITLTVKNTTTMERAMFAHLLGGFRKVRQTTLWRQTVKGGFVACEITNRGRGWHPHLHILADAEWLSLTTSPPSKRWNHEKKREVFQKASKELEAVWCKAIGQKTASTHVRRKFGKIGATQMQVEAMKYAVKPGALLECKGSALAVIRAMKGTRLFSGFGSCYGAKLDDQSQPRKPCLECGMQDGYVPEAAWRKETEIRTVRTILKLQAERKTAVKSLHESVAKRRAEQADRDLEDSYRKTMNALR